jgi:hypothetical protein
MAAQFSIFSGGGLRFTSHKPAAESIYENLRTAWGPLFNDDPDSEIAIETFAEAKVLGLAQDTLRRAGNEANPLYCTELLPRLEIDWRVNPPPDATLSERRGLLAASMAPKGGDRIAAITLGLQGIIGDGLLAVVPQEMPLYGEAYGAIYPAPADLTQVDGHPGNFVPLGNRYKAVRLIASVDVGYWAAYYRYVAGEVEPIAVGETVTINPSGCGRIETITVVDSTAPGYPDEVGIFWATFLKTHEPDDHCTTAASPYWISNRRFLYIVVDADTLASPPLCQRCHDYLAKAVGRAVRWALVDSSGAGTSGPFLIGSSPIGHTPISQVTYGS